MAKTLMTVLHEVQIREEAMHLSCQKYRAECAVLSAECETRARSFDREADVAGRCNLQN